MPAAASARRLLSPAPAPPLELEATLELEELEDEELEEDEEELERRRLLSPTAGRARRPACVAYAAGTCSATVM